MINILEVWTIFIEENITWMQTNHSIISYSQKLNSSTTSVPKHHIVIKSWLASLYLVLIWYFYKAFQLNFFYNSTRKAFGHKGLFILGQGHIPGSEASICAMKPSCVSIQRQVLLTRRCRFCSCVLRIGKIGEVYFRSYCSCSADNNQSARCLCQVKREE